MLRDDTEGCSYYGGGGIFGEVDGVATFGMSNTSGAALEVDLPVVNVGGLWVDLNHAKTVNDISHRC